MASFVFFDANLKKKAFKQGVDLSVIWDAIWHSCGVTEM